MEIELCNLLKTMFENISEFENLERQGLRGSITNEMGEPYTLERLKAEKQENELLLNKTRKEIERDRLFHVRYGVGRDTLPLLGFIAIVTAKIFQWLGL